MSWLNVKLILAREVRDQLRDRRTLFMIAVLPILLYPLLGMSFVQISQFLEEKPTRVLMAGAAGVVSDRDLPPLVDTQRPNRFNHVLFSDPTRARLLELHYSREDRRGSGIGAPDRRVEARRAILAAEYDAAVYFPPDFTEKMERCRQANLTRLETIKLNQANGDPGDSEPALQVPEPEIIFSSANEKSQIAFARVSEVLNRWKDEILKRQLVAVGLPSSAAKPFDVGKSDVAEGTGLRGAALWSKVLPVLLLLWAMTGAFYPAVDLCAGEKERGTLETLLSSPAERSEIVLGKLLTIMIFSMATAVLNLVSMGITGWLLLAKLPQIGPPPAMAAVWLSIALVPVAAMFSAVCLALAAFARSTKEGQYYLMPVMLVTMPLVIAPMAPGVELSLGNSLIPVSGVVLMLRSMMEGNFLRDWPFVFPVAAVTLACCVLAVRWAVEQFNSESVLFRESERFHVGLWLRHLRQDRKPTPTVAAALFCGVLILVARFFISLSVPQPKGFHDTAVLALVTQLALILAPAVLMTVILTSSPRQTLLLRRPSWLALAVAAALAVVLHPSVLAVRAAVMRLYPISDQVREQFEGMFAGAPAFWQLILVMAVLPAICEELAFRGFVLSGFRHLGHRWRAIVYSALLFGLTHAILQQQILTCLVGLVIGLLAVQSGSILPGMLFHVIHNALMLAAAQVSDKITPQLLDRWPLLAWLVAPSDEGMVFRWPAVVASALAALALLAWFQRLPYTKSAEEERYEALLRASHTED